VITSASLQNLLATKDLLLQGVEIKPGRLYVLRRGLWILATSDELVQHIEHAGVVDFVGKTH